MCNFPQNHYPRNDLQIYANHLTEFITIYQ